jgi:hypothetical protein
MLEPHTTSVTTASTKPVESTEDADQLAALAKTIRTEHTAAQTAMRNAVAHALNAGDALAQAKAALSGNWLDWLRSNCSLSVRTAQLYMRLAQHRLEIEHKLSGAPDFTVRAAQRFVSKPNRARRMNIRCSKLGEATITKLKGTSLDSAAELDELIMLNRGAPEGGHTARVKQLVEAAVAGKEVSAIAVSPKGEPARTLTLALRTALSKQAKGEETAPSLNAILAKLRAQQLDLHDIAIVIKPRSSACARRRGA